MNIESSYNYFDMGANVLPIRGNTKKPALQEWDHLQTDRQTKEELSTYDWEKCTGIGIVCGINGYTNIDFDKLKNNDAVASFLKYLGLDEKYPWRAKSGSGTGEHIWVRVTETLPFQNGVVFGNSKDGSFDHLEIRWKECQTLVPPSLHKSGNMYEWINGNPTEPPQTVEVSSIVEAFDALCYLKTDDPNKEKPSYKKSSYTEIITSGVDEGQRNDTLASMFGHLRKVGMEYSESLEWLKLWNSKLSCPLDTKEIESVAESIFSYPSGDFVLRSGLEMSMMNMPVMNDIVEGIIGEKSLNFLAGEEGGGKSLLAMNLALSVAVGRKSFLNYPIKKHGKVLYLNNELSFEVFVKRLKMMRMSFGKDELKKLDNFLAPEIVKPLNDSWNDIIKTVIKEEPTFLILDCLYWAHDKKENDSSDMKELMRKLVSLRDKYRLAVLVVHHTKKGVRHETMHNDAMRGSQVFSAGSDSVLLLKRSGKDEI